MITLRFWKGSPSNFGMGEGKTNHNSLFNFMKQNLNVNTKTKEELINQLNSISYLSEMQKIQIFLAWQNKQSLSTEDLKAKITEVVKDFKEKNHKLAVNLF